MFFQGARQLEYTVITTAKKSIINIHISTGIAIVRKVQLNMRSFSTPSRNAHTVIQIGGISNVNEIDQLRNDPIKIFFQIAHTLCICPFKLKFAGESYAVSTWIPQKVIMTNLNKVQIWLY